MSEPQIWYDLCRKTCNSEEEGRAIIEDKNKLEMMKVTLATVLKTKLAQGYELTQVHTEGPILVVNTGKSRADYKYYVQMVTTALAWKR